jgi:hypothetical protein
MEQQKKKRTKPDNFGHNVPHSEEAKRKISQTMKGRPNKALMRETKVVGGITLYQCGVCKGFFPRTDFYASRTTIIGIMSNCKPCGIRIREERRQRNKLSTL